MASDALVAKAQQALSELFAEVRPQMIAAFGSIEADIKKDETVVTVLDRQIETRIRDVLTKLDPTIGIEGEEFGITGSRDRYWLVDPIDGTEQFIRGIPTCKHLITLIEDGRPEWAMMDLFVPGDVWTAQRDKGTWCNEKQVRVKYRPLSRSWLDLSVNLLNPDICNAVLNVRKNIAGFTIFRDITATASGKTDGSICYGSGGGPWDYAPRFLFFTESGHRMTNIGSDTYDFTNNDFLAAHPDNFDALMEFLLNK